MRRHPGPGTERVKQDLALVVGRAASQDLAVPLHRLEWGRVPFIERFDRLDVVVAVDQHGRSVRVGSHPLREHCGQTRPVRRARLPELGRLEPGPAEVVG